MAPARFPAIVPAVMKVKSSPEILFVEDDPQTRDEIECLLARNGFQVTPVADVKRTYEALADRDFDLILLDVLLQDGDGWSVCQRLRAESQVPIVMLSGAWTDASDRTRGLTLGADDYVTKPYHGDELVERIRAVLRRSRNGPKRWRLVSQTRSLYDPQGRLVQLSEGLFDLFYRLVKDQPRALSRGELLPRAPVAEGHEQLWQEGDFGNRNVDRQISRLRRALENANPGSGVLIEMEYGHGYKVAVPVDLVE